MQVLTFSESLSSDMIDHGVLIHPTNSCYGIAARIDDQKAYDEIYAIKGRPRDKPFFITVSSLDRLNGIALYDARMDQYMSEYPEKTFTFLLPRSPDLAEYINPGFTNVGIQLARGDLLKVCDLLGGAMFGTSANLAGEEPIYTSKGIQEVFGSCTQISFLDAGDFQEVAPSTIIDLSGDQAKLIRGSL